MNFSAKFKFGIGLLLQQSVAFAGGSSINEEKPHIVFIEVDDLNYEYLSCAGSKYNKTPNVDQLALTGVRFSNACAQGMMSGPSRNSLITGLYPHNLGFYINGDCNSLPRNVWTMPKVLQKTGYYTSFIGKCHVRPYIAPGSNKDQAMKDQMGFDYVTQTVGRVLLGSKKGEEDVENEAGKDWYMSYLESRGLVQKFMDEYPKISTLPEDAYLDGFFTRSAIDFIANYKQTSPLFLWLNYSVPHGPYDVAKEYHIYKPQNMQGFTTQDFNEPELLVKKAKLFKTEEDAREEQAGLCASVAFMDRQVGRVVQSLKDKGIYENTVIVFFSDQGTMMGDHHRGHKGTLYRQITNPSLIISYPKEFKSGVVENSPVELIDLIRTTLDIAMCPSEEDLFKRKYSMSLLPLVKGNGKSVRKYAFAEIEGYQMVTDGRYRYIQGADASLLFDDELDPKNLHDISSKYPNIVKQMKFAIEDWFKETGKALPRKTF